MLNYKDYEKKVYDWLIDKNRQDPAFTFSLRQKGSKGAETDYFIGTEKSNYFSTTFWHLPVAFPGSSGDCMGLLFVYTKTGYNYFFEFTQTKTPHDDQNKAALALVERLQVALEGPIQFQKQPTAQNKMFTLRTKTAQKSYETVEAMFVDIEKDMQSIFPIVEDCIAQIKQQYPQFKAHRLTEAEFKVITEKFAERIDRFENGTLPSQGDEIDFYEFLKKFDEQDIHVFFQFLREMLDTFQLQFGDERLLFTFRQNRLNFTIGQRYSFYLNKSAKRGKFGVLSIDKLDATSSPFSRGKNAPWFTHFNDFNLTDTQRQLVIKGFEEQLRISKKSGYRAHNNADFERAAFNYTSSNTLLLPNNNQKSMSTIKSPLNQILYGPPGTGKTYTTITKALSIIESKSEKELKLENRDVLKSRFDSYMERGQIVFTTFHQSMSYEDFIEGIKPNVVEDSNEDKQVVYEIEEGIFKKIVMDALKPRTATKEIIEPYSFDDAWNALTLEAEEHIERNSPLTLPIQTPNLGLKITDISERGNLSLKPIYSENAKEYTVSYSRAKKLQEVFPDLSVIKNIDKEFRAVIGGSNSTAYWAVLNNLNSRIKSNSKTTTSTEPTEALPYVLIIDEINRGNVSQIFGELITLIEEDKRLGNTEALKVTLPYSKKKFGVPPNLYILGTMNTADRSVEALDTALRRRFSFTEMPPKYDLEELQGEVYGYPLHAILKKLNQRIEILLNRDHLIGHSYFLNKTEATLQESFYKNIIPLLQEYFYNDYGKIGLILGKGFVREKAITVGNQKSLFAEFDTKNEVDVVKSYELIPFIEIDFESAIQLLLA